MKAKVLTPEMYIKTLKQLKLLVEMTKQDNKRFTKEKGERV